MDVIPEQLDPKIFVRDRFRRKGGGGHEVEMATFVTLLRELCPGAAWWRMGTLKWLLSGCLMIATSLEAGASWAWLNREVVRLEARREVLESSLELLPDSPQPQPHERAGFHSGFAPRADAVRWVQVDLGVERELEAVVVVPAMLGAAEAYGFPNRFRVDASNDPLFADSVPLLDHTNDDASPVLAPWHIVVHELKARYVRFTATKLSPQPGMSSRFIFCLGELLVFSGGRNVALNSDVFAPNAVETLPTWSPRHLVDGTYALGLPVKAGEKYSNGWHSAISTTAEVTKWVQMDWGSPQRVEEIRLIPAHPRDYPDRFGFGFPRRFKVEADARVVFDSTGVDFANPGDTPVAIPTPGLQAREIRITATRLWERSGDFVFALAEIQAFGGGKNLALGSAVRSLDETTTVAWKSEHLVDGLSSSGVLIDESEWLSGLSKRRELMAELGALTRAQASALGLAQTRAVWLAGLIFLGGASFAVVAVLHSRRVREREMETLRQRISRDLHDEIGSHLGSIRLMSELALREGEASESLDEIHRLAGEAAESMRGIIWLVREGDAPKLTSLVEAMRQSAAALLKGIDWHLQAPGGDDAIAASLTFHRQVFLLFREAVHNIAKHANATRVEIELSWQSKRFRLCMVDNGRGFDVAAVTAGNGLANLRHRAEVIGGELGVISEPGKGTRITLESALS
ncbi:MAG: Signal transduction histidine kinase [Verrucomicrobia bacterium]|nr:MAG: Signal transduction histidine kinase [Verrucomicrobiota bacterium]